MVFFEMPVCRSASDGPTRSEEHTSELQSRHYLVCRLLLEKKQPKKSITSSRRTLWFAHRYSLTRCARSSVHTSHLRARRYLFSPFFLSSVSLCHAPVVDLL